MAFFITLAAIAGAQVERELCDFLGLVSSVCCTGAASSNWSPPVIEPVSRLPVRILTFTEQRPASEKCLMERE